jgi:5-methylcytosine-specific restriction endonuclease McrA
MNIVAPDTRTTLLLNIAWQPVTTITARAAFTHLLKQRITALDKNNSVFSNLDSWNKMGCFYEDQPVLRSAKNVWPIPTIIIITNKFFRRPKKKKLDLVDMAKICENTCQYCFEKFPLSELTIDHIRPKSLGGIDQHSNRVLACRRCNLQKSNHSPWYDKNGKIPLPPTIPSLILNPKQIRKEWEFFISEYKYLDNIAS